MNPLALNLDYILNGQGFGSMAAKLLASGMNPGILRPYIGDDGRSYVTINVGGKKVPKLVSNASALLTYDEWKLIDKEVKKAARKNLRLLADVRGAGLTFTIPNGMGKTVVQYQRQTDVGSATISMDALRRTTGDRPTYDITNIPMPIIHSDAGFTAREIATSREGGSPLDLTGIEMATRRVAETAEQLFLGTVPTYTYGGGTLYGLTNFPERNTIGLSDPAAAGWTPNSLVLDIIAMKKKAVDDLYRGPYMVYMGTGWDPLLEEDYSAAKGDLTLRDRIKKIDRLVDVRTLDYLPEYDIVLCHWASDVLQLMIGMDFVTVQWEENGGMEIQYKVMTIQNPRIRSEITGKCGIVHGTV